MTGAGPAAGWYPDSDTGGRRWWDGGSWTDHRQSAPQPGNLRSAQQSTSQQSAGLQPTAGLPTLVTQRAGPPPGGWLPTAVQPAAEVVLAGSSAPVIAPAGAWYPDPQQPGLLRWWDGATWSAHTSFVSQPGYPVQQHISIHTTTVGPRRSVGVAFLLTFFFGPVGLLYSSVTGGLVMIVVELFVLFLGVITFGLGWLLFAVTWVVCIIWGCVAAGG